MRETTAITTQVRAAIESDAPAIVHIIRSRFNAQFGSFYIHACEGAERFVRRQILATPLHGDSCYTVAVDGGSVVGCVELKQSASGVCLNYVAVLPSHASRGVGSELLRHALAVPRASSIVLDVLSTSTRVIDWYRRLGFHEARETVWLAGSLPSTEDGASFFAAGLPQASACLAEYGFGEFRIETATGTYTVGMLGREWFSTPVQALSDPAFHNALRLVDRGRRLLLRVTDPVEVSRLLADCSELVRTRRMTANVNDVRSALYVR